MILRQEVKTLGIAAGNRDLIRNISRVLICFCEVVMASVVSDQIVSLHYIAKCLSKLLCIDSLADIIKLVYVEADFYAFCFRYIHLDPCL